MGERKIDTISLDRNACVAGHAGDGSSHMFEVRLVFLVLANMAHRFVVKSRLSAGKPRARDRYPGHGQDLPQSRGSTVAPSTAAAADGSARAAGLFDAGSGAQPSSKRARVYEPGSCPPPTPADSRVSLEVSKAITAFARYPHKRPAGLRPDADGSLDINEVWSLWGRFHGVSKHHMLQFIAEHTFHSSGHRRFLLRSDHAGRTRVSVAQRQRPFSQKRHHRHRRAASRTLDVDAASRAPDADPSASDAASLGAGTSAADAVAPSSLDPGEVDLMIDVLSISSDSTLGTSEVKVESRREPSLPPTLLCKDEETSATSPVSCSCAPVPDPPGLLDGFSFLFTETDNFGCPVVPGDDDVSPIPDTMPHTVPDSFSDTLVGEHADAAQTANLESSGALDHDVPYSDASVGMPAVSDAAQPSARMAIRSDPPAGALQGSGVPHPSSVPRRTSVPSSFQSHPSPSPTPPHDGIPIPNLPGSNWSLKVTLDQDTRRLPFLGPGAPTYHDVVTGVGTLFDLAPSHFNTRPALFYQDSEGDTCTLTSATYPDALSLFSSDCVIRLFLAATHSAPACPSPIRPHPAPPCPDPQPNHTSLYSPPTHTLAGLRRDQRLFNEPIHEDFEKAIARWRSTHQNNPCSPSAIHSLHDLFPDDSTGGLEVLRSCFREHTPHPGSQNTTMPGPRGPPAPPTNLPPRQCPVPGTWPANEVLSAAKWIFGNPGLDWSPTPGPGGHKQIRFKFAIINHWNSGAVNVQGRDACSVADKLLSTRHFSSAHSPTSDSAWRPSSRRRGRNAHSSDTQDFGTNSRFPPAPPHFTPPSQHIPHNLSRFAALTPDEPDSFEADPCSSTIQPPGPRPPRRSAVTQTASPLSSGAGTRAPSPTRSSSVVGGTVFDLRFGTFFSQAGRVAFLSCLAVLSALFMGFCQALAKTPFARKTRTCGRHRCRGYSSQLAHRRGAGGRSLCLRSFDRRSRVGLLWKCSPLWSSRLACMAVFVLLPVILCLSWPGCNVVTSSS